MTPETHPIREDAATSPSTPDPTTALLPPTTAHLSGPAPTPIIIGIIGLLTLAGCAVWSLTDWSVNWAVAAPAGIVGLGLVIVLLGVAGLRRPRA